MKRSPKGEAKCRMPASQRRFSWELWGLGFRKELQTLFAGLTARFNLCRNYKQPWTSRMRALFGRDRRTANLLPAGLPLF